MEKDNKDSPETQPRRAYVAPRVEESAPFEHLVLSCARATFAGDCGTPDDPSTLYS